MLRITHPLWCESNGDRHFPPQMANNAKSKYVYKKKYDSCFASKTGYTRCN